MAGFVGADVEQLRLLGRELGQQAEQLEAISARLTNRIASVEWHGPDAQKFQSEWKDQLAVRVRGTAQALRDASGRAEANARQQEQTSSGSGSGPGSVASLPNLGGVSGQFPYVPSSFVWDTTRDAVNQKIPGAGWSYGQVGAFIPGADLVLDVRNVADSFSRGEVPVHELVDAAAGALRHGGPVAYGAGVAVGLWNTVIEKATEADFPSTWQSNMDFIASNPMSAAQGAIEGIVNGIPDIVKNFKFW